MTGKDRIYKAIRREAVDRTPWVPFVGCHAGALLGVPADEYLRSEDHIVNGVTRAIERYHADGIPVVFDLQIEAETLGCELAWAKENPPAVTSHPLANGTTLADLRVPRPEDGRIGLCLSAARRLGKMHPDVALYGLITGPFTLALHLIGTDIFLKMFETPNEIRALLGFCRDVCQAMAGYYLKAGCGVIALVDPMTSQIGPDQFKEFVTPAAAPVFDFIRRSGGLGSFFVCGHAQQNVKAMCECGPDNISVDENIPLQYVREVCESKNVSFGGNLQLTSVLLLGKPADAQRNAIACMDVAGERGFILAPGCDLPYATPPENLEAIFPVVSDPYQRDVARSLAIESSGQDRLNMADYGQQDKVIVDIITLDSEACAPCQYMVDAVRKVAPEFQDIVEWREHKIKYRESLVFMASLMVRNIPTICIDGQITFVSRIPPRDELVAAIQKRINEKFRMGILQRQGAIHLVGEDSPATEAVHEVLQRAVKELGADVPIRRVRDEKRFKDYGLLKSQTPAVYTVKYRLRSRGKTPEIAAVKEWVKDLL
ncbi:MAG TPA: uroporphyrinogen decarboxylase family protein [Candidatus Brocadiia bacterium]|nr:uroporphyrinogen decarboxylase family protein [Candidatus Brocadiia bacterium]